MSRLFGGHEDNVNWKDPEPWVALFFIVGLPALLALYAWWTS